MRKEDTLKKKQMNIEKVINSVIDYNRIKKKNRSIIENIEREFKSMNVIDVKFIQLL